MLLRQTHLILTGAGVTVTASGNTANIAIPGGGGGEGDTTVINYNGASAWATTTTAGAIVNGLNLSVSTSNNITNTHLLHLADADYSALLTPQGTTAATSRVSNKTANGFTATFQAAGNSSVIPLAHNVAVFSQNALPPTGTTGADAWGQVAADGT